MKRLLLFLFIVIILTVMPLCVNAEDATSIIAIEDTYVQAGKSAELNFGTNTNVLVKSGTSDNARKGLIKFDISAIDSNINVEDLVLKLYVTQKQANKPADITLSAYGWDNNWQEDTATWKSLFNTTGGYTPTTAKIGSCSVKTTSVGSFVTIEVGDYIAEKVANGEQYASILLSDENNGNSVYYFSSIDSENKDNHPTLTTTDCFYSLNAAFDADDSDILVCNIAGLGHLTDAQLITALYNKDNVLINCDVKAVDTEKATEYKTDITEWKNSFDGYADVADYNIKVFLWQNMKECSNMQQVTIPISSKEFALSYLNSMPDDYTIEETGVNKAYYLDIMQKCLDAYTYDETINMDAADDIQTYGRIVCTVATLVSAGRDCGYNDIFPDMMTKACDAIASNKKAQMLNFAVKEIMIAYVLMADKAEPEVKAHWDECLSAITPVEWYNYNSGSQHNINIYNLAGEWLRDYTGLYNSDSYFTRCWPKQLEKFDVNGMYPDNYSSSPNLNPMLYDLTTRVQMQLITGFGYDGEYRTKMDEVMENGGLSTLMTQSAAFQLPYGGRSNQYLFNEALIASCCEYEASRYKAKGNLKTAGAYKRAAHLAIQSIDRWLDAQKHIKNFYTSEKTGTESYGYYNKYMITFASFMAIGYLSTDDTIKEMPCPAEVGGYVFETTNRFNKVFANCGGYSIEIDTKSEKSYDSTGLGRIHKAGVPTELGLSMPMTASPGYTLMSGVTKDDLSIEAGAELTDGTVIYISAYRDLAHTTEIIKQTYDEVIFKVTYSGGSLAGCSAVEETYTINNSGVTINAKLINPTINKIHFRVPLLHTNGNNDYSSTTNITSEASKATVTMGDNSYTVETDGSIAVSDNLYGNRNGTYYSAHITKEGSEVEVKLTLN